MPGLERKLSPPLSHHTAAVSRSRLTNDLARTLKDRRGFELKHFECTNCEHSERLVHKDAP